MNFGWNTSLTTRTLIQLGSAVGCIIVVAACITYYLVFRAVEQRGLDHLNQYLEERVQRLEGEMEVIPKNLTIARDAFVERYAQKDPPGFMDGWDRHFERNADGATRSKREFSDDYHYAPLWVHKDAVLDEDLKRRVLIMEEICLKFQPGWVHGFRSLYGFTSDQMAVLGFDPALANWIYTQPSDYPVNTEEFGLVATRAANPERKIMWTGTTSNQGNSASLVSVVLPIELNGRHIISVGHDMLVDRLIGETERSEVTGMKHMIFRDDGRVIASPGRSKEIYDGQGKLNMKTAPDPAWRSLYAAIGGRPDHQFSGYDASTDLHFSGHRLAGPEWIYLSTLPRSVLRAQAFESTRWVLWSALASLGLELGLLGLVLRNSIARPVGELVAATRKVAAGEESVSLVFQRQDELGELAAAFNEMSRKVVERDAALRDEKTSLERRVTERTTELQAALAQQTELARLKTDFVSLVSHEFRTPLGVIMSASDVLHRYFDRLPAEKRARHLEMILSSTKNLASLIEEVLLLGRAEEGRMQFAPSTLNLERFCRTLCDEMRSATKAASTIEFTDLSSLEGAVSDEQILRHILSNLLSNAVKYSEPDSLVEFVVTRQGNDAVFTVHDYGIGIPEEDQARLFNSFTRGSNVGNRPGTGLGLVVVQRCVQLHGGTLKLSSALGHGTTVTVTLPVFQSELPS